MTCTLRNEIQTSNLLCKCICKINVFQFPKKQVVPTNANLVMLFVCKLFQSSLQVGQLKSYGISTGLVHVKTIAVFFSGVQYSAESLLSKIRRGKRQ